MHVAMQIAMLRPRPASLPADLESAVRGKDWQSAATQRQRSGNVKLALVSHAAQAKRSSGNQKGYDKWRSNIIQFKNERNEYNQADYCQDVFNAFYRTLKVAQFTTATRHIYPEQTQLVDTYGIT